MLRALDLFPFELQDPSLPIQGRIIARNHPFLLTAKDVKSFIEQGVIKATDDPDEAQDFAANGFR